MKALNKRQKRLALNNFTQKHGSTQTMIDQLLGQVLGNCHDPEVILDDPTVVITPSGGPSSNGGTGEIEEVQQ